jgi:glycosyltransferase involved in cell wall biosynthesis
MRILVVSGWEAASLRAHAINTVKMAQGFARLGHQVTLVCKRSPGGRVPPTELAALYGLTEPLRWIQLPGRVLRHRVGLHWSFACLALPVILRVRPDLIFARNYIVPWMSSRLGFTTVAESHAHPDNNTAPFLRLVSATRHRAFRLWVTISQYLADHYCSLGVPADKLIVLPDAVDVVQFGRPGELPPSLYQKPGPHVAYFGHLYDYKGIPTILEAAALLPEVQFHLVGGLPEDIERQKARIEEMGLYNVTLQGLKPQSEVPPYLWHADVLLLPPSQYHPSAQWTSPLKLGEYLASGTPVVATAIPALRDWLTDDEVKFVEPDDGKAMAEGIMDVLRDPGYAMALSQKGLKKAQTLSYRRRAEKILERLASPRSAGIRLCAG